SRFARTGRRTELWCWRARRQPDRRGPRRRGHHGVDVATAMAAGLGPVRDVDPIVEAVVGGPHEGDVLVAAPGPDVAFVTFLGGAEPGAGTALPRPHVEVVADADDPDRHRVAESAVAPD